MTKLPPNVIRTIYEREDINIVPEAILEENMEYGSLAFHVPLFMIWPFVCAMTRILVRFSGMYDRYGLGRNPGRHVPSEIQQIRSRPGLTG